ncbi:hypothetical protein [Bradyrhizobium sp. I71]|uniref:O-antigen ligase family protein n=1 Tax=Bradyrhizobium sp. I71 TaxID=2590772 RepID=UPI001EF9422F|nr:hypothetical protein [Bradyrhizobium sp. I71]ULK95934.1 hypothetical protein FJV43_24635 [Bradyrhizobium sp. I71]
MLIAFRLLIVFIATIPAFAAVNDALARGGIAQIAAVLVTLSAATVPLGDLSIVWPLLRRVSLAIAFPIAWMVLQIVPLPFTSLVNPIWSITTAAMGEASRWGHVSVDPGATLRSLVFYLAMLALMISTAFIARDRKRAETAFFVVTTVLTILSAEVLIGQAKSFAGMIPPVGSAASELFIATSALAMLCNCAVAIMAVERHLSRKEADNSSPGALAIRLGPALIGIIIAGAAARILAPNFAIAALVLGLSALFFVAAFRRLGLQPSAATIVFLIVAGIAVAIVFPHLQGNTADGIAGFASSSNAEALSATTRILSATPWLGNGVGTFRTLMPAYGDFGSVPQGAPTTALSVAIEWGWPALAVLVALALHLFVFLFRGALRRGRDWHFASTAAASILVMLAEAFCDTSLLSPAVQVIAAVIVGIGLSQSVGRTSKLK